MTAAYKVAIKLPLPFGPLQEGSPGHRLKPIPHERLQRAEFATQAEALRYARKLVEDGYGVSLTDLDGREWPHDEILRRINAIESDELIPGRREARARVIAVGLTDDDIDRLIKQAQQEVEPRDG